MATKKEPTNEQEQMDKAVGTADAAREAEEIIAQARAEADKILADAKAAAVAQAEAPAPSPAPARRPCKKGVLISELPFPEIGTIQFRRYSFSLP